MKILISGSTGLVGSALVPALQSSGHETIRLVRSSSSGTQTRNGSVTWDPKSGQLNAVDLESIDAAVHLAGENIAASRWTPAQKARIRESRVAGTRLRQGARQGARGAHLHAPLQPKRCHPGAARRVGTLESGPVRLSGA